MYNGSNTVRWGANTEPDLADYKIYTGSSTGLYDGFRTLTTTSLSQIVSGLDHGTIWYHAVTARDTAGNESTFSAEVSRLVTVSVLSLLRRVA